MELTFYIINAYWFRFVWYRKCHGDNVKFLDNNEIELCGTNPERDPRRWQSEIACIDYIIDLNFIKQLSFQVILNEFNNYLGIGFFVPNKKSIENKWRIFEPDISDWHTFVGDKDGFNFAVYQKLSFMRAIKAPDKYPNLKIENEDIRILSECVSGDVIGVYIDGLRKSIEVFHNNCSVGVIFTNIPNELIPPVSCYTEKERCCVTLKQVEYYTTWHCLNVICYKISSFFDQLIKSKKKL